MEMDLMKSQRSSVRRTPWTMASVTGAILGAFACFVLSSGLVVARAQNSKPATKAPAKAPTRAPAKTVEKTFEDFDLSKFTHSTQIDNAWMPVKPGMRYVYAGTTTDDSGKSVPHRFVVTVTDLVKVINGVRTVVSWDVDYQAGVLVEAELAFFAQDNDGNVWRIGEYPEESESGKFVEAKAWLYGVEDAKAGIEMKAKPQIGTPSYSQGWAPATGFADRAQVYRMGQTTCVPMGCYENVLVISETNSDEPGAQQFKYWARNVGSVRVGWKGEGEKTKETLELVDVLHLGPEALAEVRAEALKLETSAYKNSKNVYGRTAPAEPMLGAGK